MDNKQRLQDDFLAFVHENFSNYNAAWRGDFRAAFMELSLTPKQIAFLLNPANATQQFRAEFSNAIANTHNTKAPQITLSAAFSEPVAKIATYLISASNMDDHEAQEEAFKRAALALPYLEKNIEVFLGPKTPPQSHEIYQTLSKFGQNAATLLSSNNDKQECQLKDINALDGMHAIMPLPAALRTFNL